MPSPSPDLLDHQPLAGHLVVFTGKLSLLGRKDASALVARLGGATATEVNARTTMLVVGAEGIALQTSSVDPEGAAREKSHKLKRAEELNAQKLADIRILAEEDFCELAGMPTYEVLKRQYFSMRDLVARYRALREDHLRYLVKCGVIKPVLRTNADLFFAFPDLAPIKQVHESLAHGLLFRSVVRGLIASRQGQLAFDFRIDAAPAKILTLHRSSRDREATNGFVAAVHDGALAETFFRAGSELDTGQAETQEAASAVYRKALECDPYLVPALINLANIHYSQDELVEAQALYERAIGLEPDFFEAHFNLGNIYHDLGGFAEALARYREALRLNPAYADAHFYMAVTFEKMGRSAEARPHWRAYQQLAPNGEWVELAREFSE